MRILFLATDAYGGQGGIAYYNRGLAEALTTLPEVQEVVILIRQYHAPVGEIPDKVRLIKASTGGKLRYMAATLVHSLKSFDIVICGHINLLPLAGFVAKLKSIPLVLQVHGIDVWQPVPSSQRWLLQVDKVWAVSSVTQRRMNEWANISMSKYTVIPNTIHPERYGLTPKRDDLLKRYGLEGRRVIVSMGRLAKSEQYKGFDEILESLPALIKHEPNLSYLVIGDGDDRPRLEAKSKNLNITDRVIFAGYISEEEKADHLRLGDVFAMPGRGEGFGIVYLEAMACGIPVVGSRLDGSKDALRNGTLGELVNPDDPLSVQEGILKALTKPRQIPAELNYFAWPNFVQRVTRHIRDLHNSKSQLISEQKESRTNQDNK